MATVTVGGKQVAVNAPGVTQWATPDSGTQTPTTQPTNQPAQPNPVTPPVNQPTAQTAQPTTPSTTPTTQPGQTITSDGISFTPNANYFSDTANAKAQALKQAQASGPPPQTQADAAKTVDALSKPITDAATSNTNITNALANDPDYQQLIKDSKDARSVLNQQSTLLDSYKQMEKDAGIPALDTQLLNTSKIINGTEDDIRNEVQAAGGFATDSQVLALSAARNKSLIQNYNNLLNTKQTAEDHISTMIGLASQDRQNAVAAANQQLNIDSQLADYRQKFIQNASDGYNNIIKSVGYNGLVNSLMNTDPTGQTLAQAEQVLGYQPGQLKNLGTAQQSATNLAEVQQYGVSTPYSVTAKGEVWDTQTGYAYTSPEDFQKRTGMTLEQANAKKQITSIAQLQAQQAAQQNQMNQLDIAQKQASINASNASAGSSAASAAKTRSELAFENKNGGMTPAEVQKQQTDTESATQKINSDAAALIGKMSSSNPISWNDAWNQLHASYPDLSVQAVDNLLQSQNYRR